MARNKNCWYGTGRLGADPEVRNTQGGDPIANIRVASTQTHKNKDGEKVDKTFWAPVVIFGRNAEFARDYLKKGDLVRIEGPLVSRKWTDREGVERYSTEVVIDNFNGEFEILSSKGDRDAAPSQAAPAQRQSADPRYGVPGRNSGWDQPNDRDLDQEIPF